MSTLPRPNIAFILSILPSKPGVYQYFDDEGTLIYVGKAKNLKKRVNSYFAKEQSGKVLALVRKIADLKYIVVETEFDALLLENNLIKEYQPHYNILLKDDKTYPWICITKEEFPRIFSTRKKINDGSQYFGPYPSVKMMDTLLELITELYPLRNCPHKLNAQNIASKKTKLCLQYHIKKCKGVCQGLQSSAEYQTQIQEIKELIKGNIHRVLQKLQEQMLAAAQALDFKQAQEYKLKMEALQHYQSKSMIVNPNIHDLDVISIFNQEETAFLNYLKIIDGSIIHAQTLEVKKKLDESEQEVLDSAILQIRERFQSQAPELVLPFAPSYPIPQTLITIPKIGDKKQLLELSQRNIQFYLLEKQKRQDLIDPDRHSKRILFQLKQDLGMQEIPMHIECFDNSNFQGDYAVAAMTVFKNAKASKKDYRHFNIKTVLGANDFASMEEILYRRYKRALDEAQDLPQLIVVDGGKGQLSSAYKILQQLKLENKIFLIGIAEKLEEIYKVGDPYPLLLNRKSESLKIIQQIRDEAHRFGITHYRKKHEKGLIKTELTEIQGIGLETTLKLLNHFHSVKAVRQANLESLSAQIGSSKASLVKQYFDTHA
ncbi:MAG: excinuclease ABC subunit UvrC [Bacteroidales bacterium]